MFTILVVLITGFIFHASVHAVDNTLVVMLESSDNRGGRS